MELQRAHVRNSFEVRVEPEAHPELTGDSFPLAVPGEPRAVRGEPRLTNHPPRISRTVRRQAAVMLL